jgi:pyrimidine deaminase RibD-like protein
VSATIPEAATSCAHETYEPMSFIGQPNICLAPISENPVAKMTAGVRDPMFASGG